MLVTVLPDIKMSPDPKDNPILATGVVGQVDMIVSGDKPDMLALGHIEGIPIVPPRIAVWQLQQAVAPEGVREPAIGIGR